MNTQSHMAKHARRQAKLQEIDLGNPLRNLAGWTFAPKPSDSKIANELIEGLARAKNGGTCWNPVSHQEEGTDLIFRQCPGACGQVWRINIRDKQVSDYLVHKINLLRLGKPRRLSARMKKTNTPKRKPKP